MRGSCDLPSLALQIVGFMKSNSHLVLVDFKDRRTFECGQHG